MLVLRASDGVLFIMPDRVAERCGVLRPALEDTEGSEGCVPVPGISAATLAMIVEFYTRVDESGVLDIPLAAVKARFFDDAAKCYFCHAYFTVILQFYRFDHSWNR